MNKLVWLVLVTLAGFGIVLKGLFSKSNEPAVDEGLWV